LSSESKGFIDNPDMKNLVTQALQIAKDKGSSSPEYQQIYQQIHQLHNKLINQVPARLQSKERQSIGYPALNKEQALANYGAKMVNGQPEIQKPTFIPFIHKTVKGSPLQQEMVQNIMNNPHIQW
jgi:predicted Zn-dependent protease